MKVKWRTLKKPKANPFWIKMFFFCGIWVWCRNSSIHSVWVIARDFSPHSRNQLWNTETKLPVNLTGAGFEKCKMILCVLNNFLCAVAPYWQKFCETSMCAYVACWLRQQICCRELCLEYSPFWFSRDSKGVVSFAQDSCPNFRHFTFTTNEAARTTILCVILACVCVWHVGLHICVCFAVAQSIKCLSDYQLLQPLPRLDQLKSACRPNCSANRCWCCITDTVKIVVFIMTCSCSWQVRLNVLLFFCCFSPNYDSYRFALCRSFSAEGAECRSSISILFVYRW